MDAQNGQSTVWHRGVNEGNAADHGLPCGSGAETRPGRAPAGLAISALAVVFLMASAGAMGQAFTLFVDIKTVSERGADAESSPLQARLFLSNESPAPPGTALWFLVDTHRNGLALEGLSPRTDVRMSEILGLDDFVLLQDRVDGDQPGTWLGGYRRMNQEIELPAGLTLDALGQGNIYALLWDDMSFGPQPAEGSRFGILNIGVNPLPAEGNVFWAIDQNLVAGSFTLVPEPELALAGAAGILGLWAASRRLRR